MTFPHYIDNTMLKAWRRCPQHFFHRHVQGLVPAQQELSVDLVFGQCFAAGLEMTRKAFYVEGRPADEAVGLGQARASGEWHEAGLITPARSNKTYTNLVDAIDFYFSEWKLGEDGLTPEQGGIEVGFSMRLNIAHPYDGKALYYVGRCDMVARNKFGSRIVVDEKTTSNFSDAWLAQWDMDPQMTGYIIGQAADMALIRGVSISSKGFGRTEVPVMRTAHQREMWQKQLARDVIDMISMYQNETWRRSLGQGCVAYGRACEFTSLCNSPNPQALIDSSFKIEKWVPYNPLQEKP